MNRYSAVAYDLDDEYSDAYLPSDVRKPISFAAAPGRTGETADVVKASDAIEAAEELRVVLPIKELRNEEYRITLREPIAVYFDGESEYVAFHEKSNVYGKGEDVPSAFRDFSNAFITIYFSYVQSSDPLSAGAEKFVSYLRSLVENIEELHDRRL